jgi:hypothetical protein
MPYVMVDDFAAGIDRRKSALTAPPGSLRNLRNAFITAGGEIEKRQTFSFIGTLPAGTSKGLAFDGDNLVVFGLLDPASVVPMPPNVTYQQLSPSAGGITIDEVIDVHRFGAHLYVVARTSDGVIRHFYNGAELPDADVQGNSVTPYKTKMYATDGANLRFSAIRDATDWTVGAGNGIIDVTQETSRGGDIVAATPYYSFLAVFQRTAIQIWGMDVDPVQNALQQVLDNIGLVGRHAVSRYGTGDVLFLSDTGIRSLRARDSSNSASVNDVGSPVDELVFARRAVLAAGEADRIRALVDPLTGRFWLQWGSEIFCLSTYPNSKISAWSLLDTGTAPDEIITANSRIVMRIGEDLFLYGLAPDHGSPFDPNAPLSMAAQAYDETQVAVETPFFDAGRPATTKEWQSIDMTAVGTWVVEVNPDPTSATPKWTQVATVTKPTWGLARVPLDMHANHLAIRLTSINNGPARLSNMALHFREGDAS